MESDLHPYFPTIYISTHAVIMVIVKSTDLPTINICNAENRWSQSGNQMPITKPYSQRSDIK